MDDRPHLNRHSQSCNKDEPRALPRAVDVDQVIFTSIRTPMGEGYRIVAACAGLAREEQADITRRAPSHGSMDRHEPDAVGLIAFRLVTGRHCVGRVRHAGREHSGRGGYRVYTEFALLNPDAFSRFAFDPVWVCGAIADATNPEPILKPPPSLPKLSLRCDPALRRSTTGSMCPSQLHAVKSAAQAVLDGRTGLIVGSKDPMRLLSGTLSAVPAVTRAGVSSSAGLRFSPSRGLQLCVARTDASEAQQAVRGQEIGFIDASRPARQPRTDYDNWLDMAMDWLAAGRDAELASLTDPMSEDVSVELLNRAASIARDLGRVADADPPLLADLDARYAGRNDGEPGARLLLERIRGEIRRRLSQTSSLPLV